MSIGNPLIWYILSVFLAGVALAFFVIHNMLVKWIIDFIMFIVDIVVSSLK